MRREAAHHRGAVRERSQGLSLRNPWLQVLRKVASRRDARHGSVNRRRFSHPSRMQTCPRIGPGVSKTQPLATFSHRSAVIAALVGQSRAEFGVRRLGAALVSRSDHSAGDKSGAEPRTPNRSSRFGFADRFDEAFRVVSRYQRKTLIQADFFEQRDELTGICNLF